MKRDLSNISDELLSNWLDDVWAVYWEYAERRHDADMRTCKHCLRIDRQNFPPFGEKHCSLCLWIFIKGRTCFRDADAFTSTNYKHLSCVHMNRCRKWASIIKTEIRRREKLNGK